MKDTKSGDAAVRRSQYIYYNQLLFLKGSTTGASIEDSIEEEGTHIEERNTNEEPVGPYPPYPRTARNRRKKQKVNESESEDLVNLLRSSVQSRMQRDALLEEDEDRMFLMSLLSSFKRVPQHRKASLKVKLINDIEAAQYSDSLSDVWSFPSTSQRNYVPQERNNYYHQGYFTEPHVNQQPNYGARPPSTQSTESTASSDYVELSFS